MENINRTPAFFTIFNNLEVIEKRVSDSTFIYLMISFYVYVNSQCGLSMRTNINIYNTSYITKNATIIDLVRYFINQGQQIFGRHFWFYYIHENK